MKTKIVQLSDELSDKLDEIKEEVKNRGGSVSISRLLRDSLGIFVSLYRDRAIEKYSPLYEVKGDE